MIDWLRAAHIAQLAIRDAWDAITGSRPPMTPSRVQAFRVGTGDFRAVGEHLASLLIDAGGLRPHENVLDVGCGIGRAAVPLTRYLTTGAYFGFDINRDAIRWCQRNIPRFRFTAVDVFNSHYNPRGAIKAEEFSFPVPDASFDVVFLSSILTHLTPPAAARYVAETSRVLRPGGRAVMTWFLIDDAVRERMTQGKSDRRFTPASEPWWFVQDEKDPELAVAYETAVVENALRERDLTITKISRGQWSGHADGLTHQDLVVALRNTERS